MKLHSRFLSRASGLVLVSLVLSSGYVARASVATVTTLSLSPSGSVSAGTVVTLTATVTAGSSAVNPGQVLFCDATSAHCEYTSLLGQAQLTTKGVATVHLRLGIGSHSIKAVFQGTLHGVIAAAGSSSSVKTLTVTGTAMTTTSISSAGTMGDYSFTGKVNAYGRIPPGGTLSFLDTNHGNSLLGSTLVDWVTAPLSFLESSPSTPYIPYASGVADFNNDGIPDLINLNWAQSYPWTALLGNGNGGFTAKYSLYVPDNEYLFFVVDDFNSDGNPDVAVFNPSSNASVMLGIGDGTFTPAPLGNTGISSETTPVVADFNGDGIPDLAVTSSYSGVGFVQIEQGNGDGSFTALNGQVQLNEGVPFAMAVADFNGDGIPDLVVTVGAQPVYILLGNGDGTFIASTVSVCACGSDFMPVTPGDFNGDGIPDLVLPGQVLLGKGDGTFTMLTAANVDSSPFVVGDFNGDGIEDLAGGYTPEILLGKGNGTFPTVLPLGLPPVAESLVAADFNGDGVTDLDAAYYSGIDILLRGVTGTATINNISLAGSGAHDIVAAYSGDKNYGMSESPELVIQNIPPGPVLTPVPGTYHWTQNVAISDSRPGAVFYYTLDGSQPTTGSTLYTGAISVGWQANLHAIAVFSGPLISAVTGGIYAIDRPLLPPSFSAPGGTYSKPFTFSITPNPQYCTTGVCEIYYSVHGEGFQKYNGPVTIDQFGTSEVKAVTTEWHYTTSPAATVIYQIK